MNMQIENVNVSLPKKQCPICNCEHFFSQRYSNAVCKNCCLKAVDEFGNSVKYYNTNICGGFESIHIIDNIIVKKQDHYCWIDEKKCYSDEARFGGIVIEIIPKVL